MTETDKRAAYASVLAFFMSTVLTGWFIHSYGGYLPKQTMLGRNSGGTPLPLYERRAPEQLE